MEEDLGRWRSNVRRFTATAVRLHMMIDCVLGEATEREKDAQARSYSTAVDSSSSLEPVVHGDPAGVGDAAAAEDVCLSLRA